MLTQLDLLCRMATQLSLPDWDEAISTWWDMYKIGKNWRRRDKRIKELGLVKWDTENSDTEDSDIKESDSKPASEESVTEESSDMTWRVGSPSLNR